MKTTDLTYDDIEVLQYALKHYAKSGKIEHNNKIIDLSNKLIKLKAQKERSGKYGIIGEEKD